MTTHPEHWAAKTRTERDAEIVRRLLAADEREKAVEIARDRGEPIYVADDGNAEVEYEYVSSASEAAEEYVSSGYWGDDRSCSDWVTVYAWTRYRIGDVRVDADDRDSYTVEIEADEPDCCDDHEHDWCSPLDVVGGIAENPGCWGHGGGVIIHEVCRHCGCLRTTDTWAQRSDTGEQGLTSVEYRTLDDEHAYADAWREWSAEQGAEVAS